MTTITIPDNWLPTSENINALPEPLRKYIHDQHTASDYATLIRQEALTRAEYNILRKMIEEAPEGRFEWVVPHLCYVNTDTDGGPYWPESMDNKRVRLVVIE